MGGVEHIMGPGERRPHRLTAWAKVEDGRISYSEPTGDGHPVA